MLLVGKGPAAFVLSMAFVGASVASATAPQTLAASQCTITSMSGFDNLCLFYSFAYRTRLSAAVLRQQVCEYMRKNSGTIIPGAESDIRGVDYTIEQYVRDEGSDMNSLTVKRLRDEGAGLPVAGSLSMMLRRNVWVYILLNGAYQLILATTVVVDAPPLVLKFSLNGRGIGHYDIINLNERASVERPLNPIKLLGGPEGPEPALGEKNPGLSHSCRWQQPTKQQKLSPNKPGGRAIFL